MITKVDDDLKLLVNAYTDKTVALATVKRKKNINLITSDLEDFLQPNHILSIDSIDTENLLTLLVIVPKTLESGNNPHVNYCIYHRFNLLSLCVVILILFVLITH